MNEFSLSDLAAVTGGNRNNDDGWGNGGWWILLLFILLGGGINNRGYGSQGGGYGAGGVGGNELYPWLNQSNQINDGFRDQMLNTTVNGIQQSVNNLATQLCSCCGDIQMALANGFNGVNQGMCNGFNSVNTAMMGGFNDLGMNMMQGFNGVNLGMLQGFNGAEQAANARQMADMQQAFAAQTAMMQGFNALQAQQADCCCENRLATANQTAALLAEHCSDRAALSDGIRDVIANQTAMAQRQIDAQNAGTQAIMDKLCQLELDGYKRQVDDERRANAELRSQLTQARFDASQQAQNALIQNGFANEVDQLYNRLSNCPVPTTPVYGRTPIFTCQNNSGCPCMG